MAGRIRDEDIATVRERADIEAIVSQHVTLKRSGSSLKGLCPFHDEKSGSFYVTPARGSFHCFGCGEGGDAIAFLMKIDNLPFVEAVEYLAEQAGITLRYEQGHTGPSPEERAAARGQRARLIDAHAAAQAFFTHHLTSPEALPARQFLHERGFTPADAARFGVGYSPNSWDALIKHLKGKGFTDTDLVTSGLVSTGDRGSLDRFRGRLMFPIRDTQGEIIGFGARKLLDADKGPKYLNSPETPIYKKTSVLYGVDTARRAIAKTGRAVIVEGYTDVMACHLAGVESAVATCGTAFGEEHVRVLRRLLGETHKLTGEVIYTFDGDAAGQKAAIRSFELDEKFLTRTFVAVEPSGMDPCELRIAQGDQGVTNLLNARVPLFEFAVKARLARHDLATVEGRINALSEAAPIIARIKDPSLRPEYARTLGRWLGMDVDTVMTHINRAEAQVRAESAAADRRAPTTATNTAPSVRPAAPATPYTGEEPPPDDYYDGPPPEDYPYPDEPAAPAAPTDPAAIIPNRAAEHLARDRALLRAIVQCPTAIPTVAAIITALDFTHPAYAATWDTAVAAAKACGADTNPAAAIHFLPAAAPIAPNPAVRAIMSALAVEPFAEHDDKAFSFGDTDAPTPQIAEVLALTLAVEALARRETTLKAVLNDPTATATAIETADAELDAVITRRRTLHPRMLAAHRALRGR